MKGWGRRRDVLLVEAQVRRYPHPFMPFMYFFQTRDAREPNPSIGYALGEAYLCIPTTRPSFPSWV